MEYASDELKADKEVVLVAVKNWGNAIEYADIKLQVDREIALIAVRNSCVYKELSYELKMDEEILFTSIQYHSATIYDIPLGICTKPCFIRKLVYLNLPYNWIGENKYINILRLKLPNSIIDDIIITIGIQIMQCYTT